MLTKEFINKLKYYHTRSINHNKDSRDVKKTSKFIFYVIFISTYGILEIFYVAIEYYKALNISQFI